MSEEPMLQVKDRDSGKGFGNCLPIHIAYGFFFCHECSHGKWHCYLDGIQVCEMRRRQNWACDGMCWVCYLGHYVLFYFLDLSIAVTAGNLPGTDLGTALIHTLWPLYPKPCTPYPVAPLGR